MSDLIQQLNTEMADLVEQVRDTLVRISNGVESHGAGIIVHPAGLILTNAHVIRAERVKVTLADGTTLPARLIAYDKEHDLAALRVKAENLPAIELGDSNGLLPGQWVLALGHPWGVPGAVTSGIAISGGSEAATPNLRGRWLAANLAVRPGNSGGPLVDAQGRLLGINTVMAGPDVGLAVPVSVVKAFLKEALKTDTAPDDTLPEQPSII